MTSAPLPATWEISSSGSLTAWSRSENVIAIAHTMSLQFEPIVFVLAYKKSLFMNHVNIWRNSFYRFGQRLAAQILTSVVVFFSRALSAEPEKSTRWLLRNLSRHFRVMQHCMNKKVTPHRWCMSWGGSLQNTFDGASLKAKNCIENMRQGKVHEFLLICTWDYMNSTKYMLQGTKWYSANASRLDQNTFDFIVAIKKKRKRVEKQLSASRSGRKYNRLFGE